MDDLIAFAGGIDLTAVTTGGAAAGSASACCSLLMFVLLMFVLLFLFFMSLGTVRLLKLSTVRLANINNRKNQTETTRQISKTNSNVL